MRIKTKSEHFAFGYGDKLNLYKILFWDDKEGWHITILFNDYKKEVDIHKTIDNIRNKNREPILKIKYYTGLRILIKFKHTLIKLIKKFWLTEIITIKKLNKIDSILIAIDNFQNEEVFIDRRRKKKYRFKSEIDLDRLSNCFISPNEIESIENESFFLFTKRQRRIRKTGLVFKVQNKLYFVSNSNFQHFYDISTELLLKIIKEYNLVKEISSHLVAEP